MTPEHAEYSHDLAPEFHQCRACQCAMPTAIKLEEKGIHHARLVCSGCGVYIRFLPKPGQEKKRRPAAARNLVREFSRGFCEMCTRRERDLPPGQCLEAHHVVPYSPDEAATLGFDEPGDNTRENIQIVCTGCHRLIDWARTYVRTHYGRMLRAVGGAE